jgi:sugar (pentulose or hexulose) kinase
MRDIVGNNIETIHMVGGGIKDETLCRFVANATGKRVVAGPIEATGTGNAIMQFYALGKVAGLEEGRGIVKNSFDAAEYLPQDTAVWQAAYERFCDIIEKSR